MYFFVNASIRIDTCTSRYVYTLHCYITNIYMVCKNTYIISYTMHSPTTCKYLCVIYSYINTTNSNNYITSITIHTMKTPMYIIIPSTLHTYVYIYSTYRLQECVCFRKHPHTAPDQQSNTNTEKNNITYKFIQVKRVSNLYTHRRIIDAY